MGGRALLLAAGALLARGCCGGGGSSHGLTMWCVYYYTTTTPFTTTTTTTSVVAGISEGVKVKGRYSTTVEAGQETAKKEATAIHYNYNYTVSNVSNFKLQYIHSRE